jgi:hypothetical protein
VSTAGGLSSAITGGGNSLATVTDLTVTGIIDARDFKILRDNMPLLATLDLSGATIAAGVNIPGTTGTMNYPAGEIQQHAFHKNNVLYSKCTTCYNLHIQEK